MAESLVVGSMKDLLMAIAQNLVDTPEAVTIEESGSVQTVVYRVTPKEGETGYLIGRGGVIAQSIRTVMNSVGRKQQKHVVVEIAGDEDSDPVGVAGFCGSRR